MRVDDGRKCCILLAIEKKARSVVGRGKGSFSDPGSKSEFYVQGRRRMNKKFQDHKWHDKKRVLQKISTAVHPNHNGYIVSWGGTRIFFCYAYRSTCRQRIYLQFYFPSFFISSTSRKRLVYPERSSGHAVITGVLLSPPPAHAFISIAHT